ncbi:hypothetical protein LTT66_32585 [Nocardia gipuzkoensis]|uniref:hypothetical protein n=1 Tax=Nocardia gipuzkoensis TaxID=2749991 RepID=UPI001E4D81E3|nr:hypothetical protein [Nocardia gipuzkoensis]UGT67864.1 hypothetical protein LTT66_32585 [Nocardia gipuzkoensis]
MELDRQQYTIKRTELGKALAPAGLNPDVQQRIRTLVDDRARQAGEFSRSAAARRQQWRDKTANIVAGRRDRPAPGRLCRPQPTVGTLHKPSRTCGADRLPQHFCGMADSGGGAVTDIVDLHVIARLDDPTGAVADLYACELFYSDDGSVYGRHVSCRWESVPAAPGAPSVLTRKAVALTASGYTHTGEWRRKTTSSDDDQPIRPAPARNRRPGDPMTPEQTDLRQRLQAQLLGHHDSR